MYDIITTYMAHIGTSRKCAATC